MLNTFIQKLDNLQRRHKWSAFSYAVVKKYGEDQAGYQAALLTYYAFLSLFPLLLVLTTLTSTLAGTHPQLQQSIIRSITNYFPVIGSQLSAHVHTLHKTGIALVVGLLFTFYGARGVADAFRNGVNHIYRVPKVDRDGFPKSLIKSLEIITVGGAGLIGASIVTGLAASAGHGFVFRAVSLLLDAFILFWLFEFLLNVSLPRHITLKETRVSAASAAVGLVVLQTLGGYVLAHELKSLDALYSYFAIALGLLFWLYLQAQMLYYSVEIAVVGSQKLWPRSLSGKNLTATDKRAISHLAKKEQTIGEETIETQF